MKIKREINGQMIEIELTEQELYQAYCEQEEIFDRDSCDNYFEMMYCHEKWYEDVDEESRLNIVEAAATELRRNINKYDMSWDYAMDEAFRSSEVRELIIRFKRGD